MQSSPSKFENLLEMLHRTQRRRPEARLEILDLIHLRNLETWIKRYAG